MRRNAKHTVTCYDAQPLYACLGPCSLFMFDPITTLAQAYHSDPVHYFHALNGLSDFIWLDSGRPASTQGRYDIFCAEAKSKVIIDSQGKHWLNEQGAKQAISPMQFDKWVSKHTKPTVHQNQSAQALPFIGGIIGYMGYAWQNTEYKLPISEDYTGNIAELFAFDWALVIDHQNQSACLVDASSTPETVHELERISALLSSAENNFAAQNGNGITGNFSCSQFTADTTREQYHAAIDDIHEYILSGDCYQVNFAQRFSAEFKGELDTAYLKLRAATPSPFSAYFKTAKNPILSLSPERFLAFDGKQVLTQPIKGSSPRGRTPEEDAALAQALLASEKNRAENVMIVDLLRNDLSQCCKPFSVKVPKLFELQTFANVHHLVSTVTGELENDCDAFTLFKKSFPGGSITGAPKKRAMEIIAELEPHSRGVYCGSVAYFSRNGKADSSITIRTLQADGNRLYCWGGGGIVLDSEANQEFDESLFKVRKLMAALNPDT